MKRNSLIFETGTESVCVSSPLHSSCKSKSKDQISCSIITRRKELRESPTTKLANLRISLLSSRAESKAKNLMHTDSACSEHSPPDDPCLVSAPSDIPTTPRTLRRACKDEALSRIFEYSINLSTGSSHNLTAGLRRQPRPPPVRRFTERPLLATRKTSPIASPAPRKQPSLSNKLDRMRCKNWSPCPAQLTSASESDWTVSSVSTSSSDQSSSDDQGWNRKSSRKRRAVPRIQASTQETPVVPKRSGSSVVKTQTINAKLHASHVPDYLPCRYQEYQKIFDFVLENLINKTGGCMYISGVPGTGKTATVNAVLTSLSQMRQGDEKVSIPAFTFIAVNGMQIAEPRQTYVQIYQHLTGNKTSAAKAMQLLEAEFCESGQYTGAPRSAGSCKTSKAAAAACVLLVDELDLLCTKRQDVLYSLFDWPCRPTGRRSLVVLAIANTMDLPERLLHHRVASRLGLHRLPFAPYSHTELAEIVRTHLGPALCADFAPKAIELATRKVAAVSGDARRALDICRRAVELAHVGHSQSKTPVRMEHLQEALREMFSSLKVVALRSTSLYEKLFLRAILSEANLRTSDDVRLDRCIEQAAALCHLKGLPRPTNTDFFNICASLGAYKLLITEPCRRDTSLLIRLNCSKSDVLFALKGFN